MNRRNFFGVTAAVPIASQLWPEISFAQPNAKEYEKMALEFCESKYPIGAGTKGYLSVTGEPYIVLNDRNSEVDKWIKPEGVPFDDFYGGKTPDEALEAFKKAFLGYTSDKGNATLHWREKPTLQCQINVWGGEMIRIAGSTSEWYRFYARLLVTKTPPVEYYKRAREGTLT